ncbi:acetyltransferase, putative [Lachnospiraceae bacterium KM106-2]|nr:acetyltransferase, putative [Lachnospiraceae bacterium KM106-2]
MKYQFLESEHIYLRPFNEADIPFFIKWYNDKETRAKIGETMPTSEFDAENIVRRKMKDSVWFAIISKEDNKIIGETGLLRMFPAWRTTDLSIIIPDKKDQGKGYGTEAINLMMDYAFGYLAYNRIAIGVVGFNTNALAFYKKVGFKKEGIQEQGYYYNYHYHDFIMMRILKDEFVANSIVSSDEKM